MGTGERSKKKTQLWKKAIVHFLLCFVMGFFTGFAPTSRTSSFSAGRHLPPDEWEFSPETVEKSHGPANANRSLMAESPAAALPVGSKEPEKANVEEAQELVPKRLIILVTPTHERDELRDVLLRRMAYTISLVRPPLLWIVVEKQSESEEVSKILRKTGVMYRHLVFKENFTDPAAEMDHQRNVALRHIELHRLTGIVHFAGLSNVYDLDFFDELRETEVFGTWPMAFLSANRKRVTIEGPVCDSSQVIGWHLRRNNNQTEPRPSVHISSFAFNSSVLWDPERWGRASSVQDNSKNSVNFVKQVALEDEAKLKGIPSHDCSRVLLWHLRLPTGPATVNLFPATQDGGPR